jgi:hypothetical protein
VTGTKTMVNIKKLVGIVIMIVAFASLISSVYLAYHYAYTRPEHPQPDVERTYPLNIYGTVVYLTKQEDSQLNWLLLCMGLFLMIGFFYVYFVDPFGQDKKEKELKQLY